jgi:hypothetical protein
MSLFATVLAVALTVGECVGLLALADSGRKTPALVSRRSPGVVDVFVRVYWGVRIEVDTGRAVELYGADSNVEAVCDRFVGWPIHGFQLTRDYRRKPMPSPGSLSLHPWWWGQEALAWPSRVKLLPGAAIVYGKWLTVVFLAMALGRCTVRWIRAARRPSWACRSCGYDLRSIPGKLCPECGREPRRVLAPKDQSES